MKVTQVPIGSLQGAAYNPNFMNKKQYGGLLSSLKRFRWLEPVVVNRRSEKHGWKAKDRHEVIVGGHNRIKAAKELGEKKVPVVYVELGEKDEQVLNLALNNHGQYDVEKLGKLLQEIREAKENLEATGFDEAEIEKAIRIAERAALSAGAEPDVPELPEKPVTKPGELLELGPHRILCGDARDPAVAKRLLEGQRATGLVSDPPYGADINNDWSKVRGSVKSMRQFGPNAGKKYDPTIGDDKPFEPGHLFELYGSREMFLFGADYYFRRIPPAEVGSWLVWEKRKDSQAEAIGSAFELIWSRRPHKRMILRHEWFGFTAAESSAEARRRVHPNQKPTSLLREILTRWTKARAVVIDPYLGSGSTLLACEQTGRSCLGVEIDPRYCDVARLRYEALIASRAEQEAS